MFKWFLIQLIIILVTIVVITFDWERMMQVIIVPLRDFDLNQ